MRKAEEGALEAYPEIKRSNYADSDNGYTQFLEDSVTSKVCRGCFVEGYDKAFSDFKQEIDRLRAESCPGHMDFWDVLDHFTEFIKQNESK